MRSPALTLVTTQELDVSPPVSTMNPPPAIATVTAPVTHSSTDDEPPQGLTGREWQVLRLIGARHSNEQIAATLFVSLATVKTHINRVYSKLNIGSREEAMQRARQLGC